MQWCSGVLPNYEDEITKDNYDTLPKKLISLLLSKTECWIEQIWHIFCASAMIMMTTMMMTQIQLFQWVKMNFDLFLIRLWDLEMEEILLLT